MKIGANTILNHLPYFSGNKIELASNQSVEDIIRGIKIAHKDFATDYDKIAHYFVGKTVEQTCRNIFNFLRANTNYFVESEARQTVKSPAAILKTKNIDCKNYALFTAGVLDAINRSGLQEIPYCYRFVSNRLLDSSPSHVFVVAFDNNREIWIDPIPEVLHFDYRLPFYHQTDKNFKAMPLYKISGSDTMGFVLPVGIDEVKNITSVITNLFGNRPNPNDWQGWAALDQKIGAPIGTNARSFVFKDGDSVSNEAINIVRWIENKGLQTVIGYDPWHKRNITMQDLANKLRRGGLAQEAETLLRESTNILSRVQPIPEPGGNGINMIEPTGATQRAGLSTPLLLALAAGAVYFIFSKK